MGDVTGMINSKRGTIEAMDERGTGARHHRESAALRNLRLHDAVALADRRPRGAEP